MDVGQVLHTSPYVTQIEKLADSMKQLTNTFLRMEEKKKAFTEDEVERMFDCVKEKVCGPVSYTHLCGAGISRSMRWRITMKCGLSMYSAG